MSLTASAVTHPASPIKFQIVRGFTGSALEGQFGRSAPCKDVHLKEAP